MNGSALAVAYPYSDVGLVWNEASFVADPLWAGTVEVTEARSSAPSPGVAEDVAEHPPSPVATGPQPLLRGSPS